MAWRWAVPARAKNTRPCCQQAPWLQGPQHSWWVRSVGGGSPVGPQSEQTGAWSCLEAGGSWTMTTPSVQPSSSGGAVRVCVCTCAQTYRGMRAGRPRILRQTVGPSRVHARFHLGLPKSSTVAVSYPWLEPPWPIC